MDWDTIGIRLGGVAFVFVAGLLPALLAAVCYYGYWREEALSTGKVLVLMLKIAAIITIAFVLIAIIGEQLVGE